MAPDTDPEPYWTVTSQVETADIGPAGTYVPGVKVSFRCANGTSGAVFLPQADYTVENVRKAIGAKADVLSAVAQLQG